MNIILVHLTLEIPPRKKKSDIFTPTKHLHCNQLWRIHKSNCFNEPVDTVPVDRFIAVDTSKMGELDFSSTSFLTVSMFSSIILVGEDLEDVTGGHKSVDNSGEGVTACEEADVVRI